MGLLVGTGRSRVISFSFSCVLMNQGELQIERFTVAPALNIEQIDSDIQADADLGTFETSGDSIDESVEL